MKARITLAVLIALWASVAAASDRPPFESLFDGHSLDGWTLVHPTGRGYAVEDGLLVCPAGEHGNLRHPGLQRARGHIGFLGHTGTVAFRNIQIADLDASGPDTQRSRPDNQPPKRFRALFNGRDLTGWKGLVADPPRRARMSPQALAEAQAKADQQMREHWKVEEGVLTYDGKDNNLCTARDYGDFELLVDWKINPGGDSGIYLRGSPQVQIWDNPEGSGGLYNNQKNPSHPLKKADHPPGEWNHFQILMVGGKVTVYLNGALVVDHVTMENYWERDQPIYPTGPIELQHHGDALYFKNIFIREIPRGDAKGG